MLEPSSRQELQCIKEVEHLWYIIVMIMWFQHWRHDQGWWPSLPECNFQVGALVTVNIKTRVMSVVSQVDLSLGERQVLQVLTTLQYLAEMGPVHSVQSIMRPLKQTEISFMPHAVLGYGTSVRLSISVKTDVSCVDISLLPLSVCSAWDLPQPKDYESTMEGMTLDPASLTEKEEQNVKGMEKNPDVETEGGRVHKE